MKIFKALSDVQEQLKVPKNNFNSFGKYKYRSAEDIIESAKPVLKANGLTLTLSDEMVEVGGRVYVKASATVYLEGESHTVTGWARESENKKGMDDSQMTGTASSYARKYALNGLFCIDDTKDADTDEYHKKTNSKLDQSKVNSMKELMKKTRTEESAVLKHYKVSSLEDMSISAFKNAMSFLEQKLDNDGYEETRNGGV